jgi:hypothetical protein
LIEADLDVNVKEPANQKHQLEPSFLKPAPGEFFTRPEGNIGS